MKNDIFPLFAYPVMICGQRYKFNESETEFVSELETIDNIGNSMSANDRVLDDARLSNLKAFIEEQIFVFKKNLFRIKDDNPIYITQSWVNFAKPGQFHPKHKHPNSVISGVMFLDDNSERRLPPIRFHRSADLFSLDFHYDELNEFNASCRLFDPEQGMLLLFPSSLEHDVEINDSDQVRKSISFNTYVRGTVGGKEQLTEVHLA